MKKMNYAEPIIDAYNAIAGTVIAVLSYILGDHWILFLAFLLLNVADWLTGWMKSRIAGKENSAKGWQGVLKKLGYWVMIMVGFGASAIFIEIGVVIGESLLTAPMQMVQEILLTQQQQVDLPGKSMVL